MAVIAVFSGSHSHGEDVAQLVAQQLGCERIEQQLVDQASQQFGLAKDKLTRTLSGGVSFFDRLTDQRDKHIASVTVILAQLILDDNKLVHGFAAHLLPRSIGHVLKVLLIANHDYRLDQATKSEGKSPKEAESILHRGDQERLAWTRRLFNKPPFDESLYDLVIPMHETSVEDAARLICEYAGSDPVGTTKRSLRQAQDFVLSAKVKLALVEAGHEAEVTSENGHVMLTLNKYVVRIKQHETDLKEIAAAIDGVGEISTRLGPKFEAPSTNPWANIEVPPKILLVDDEKDFVHTLSERLETRNIDSSVVYNGEEALDFVKDDEPDVMVLDLMMPGIDGLEVLRRVKRDHPYVEVIILTGHGSDREETLANELGAFAYLHKPVDLDTLARAMKEAYQKVSNTREAMQRGREAAGGETDDT